MLVRHMLVVFGSRVMARRRISYVSCYISFKKSFSLMRHMESSVCQLSPGPGGAEGGVAGEFMLVLDRSGVGDQDTFACKY